MHPPRYGRLTASGRRRWNPASRRPSHGKERESVSEGSTRNRKKGRSRADKGQSSKEKAGTGACAAIPYTSADASRDETKRNSHALPSLRLVAHLGRTGRCPD